MLGFISNFKQSLHDFLTQRINNQTVGFLLVAMLSFTVFLLLLRFARSKIEIIRNQEIKRTVQENLDTVNWLFCLALGIKLSLEIIFIKSINFEFSWLNTLSFTIIAYFTVLLCQQWLIYLFRLSIQKSHKEGEPINPDGLSLITTLLKIVVWALALVFILPNLGIRVDTLVASLGISGIAIAFALQNILSEVFASFSIFLDKPFQVGDFIEVGTDKGRIERIGIRSTRMRSLSGEEIVISNKELLLARIHNFKLLKNRRISFKLFFPLKTKSEKLKSIPDLVKNVIEKHQKTKFERAGIMEITDAKIVYEIVYYSLSNNYEFSIQTQQAINIEVLEILEENQIALTDI